MTGALAALQDSLDAGGFSVDDAKAPGSGAAAGVAPTAELRDNAAKRHEQATRERAALVNLTTASLGVSVEISSLQDFLSNCAMPQLAVLRAEMQQIKSELERVCSYATTCTVDDDLT